MFRAFALLVRASYLLALLVSLACMLPALVQLLPGLPGGRWHWREGLFGVLFVIVFVALPLRAAWRLVRRRDLIPELHLRDRPVVASLVLLASACALLLSAIIALALFTRLPEADVNIAGPAALAAMLFAIAILTGEIVLVGRPASNRDSGSAHAVP